MVVENPLRREDLERMVASGAIRCEYIQPAAEYYGEIVGHLLAVAVVVAGGCAALYWLGVYVAPHLFGG